MTREEKRAYHREYYYRSILKGTFKYPDPEKSRAYHREYYQKHKDDEGFKQRNKAAVTRWRANNRDRWNAYQREYARKRKLEAKI